MAFGIYSIDYHIELYGYLQTKNNLGTIKEADAYIRDSDFYNASLHEKRSSHGNTNYETLCTYIRNAIDHPDNGNEFTDEELKISIDLLVKLCNKQEY